MNSLASGPARVVVLLAAFGAPAAAQTAFVLDNSVLPATGSFTEDVDFGDVDLDGDWDALFADGGDGGNDQNRLYLNLGHLQRGTTGVFQDETATRLPLVSDDSRDTEFCDYDNDGDLDLHVTNTAQIANQSDRWWTNQGSSQGGTMGFYQDDTAARWIGLGGPGSSISPTLVLGTGGYIDWSCDCDFGDVDNDGDLDLVHSSYGGTFVGSVPTRIFLNNGAGQFSEFNPSGFQLTASAIADGDPGLWAEGLQQANTVDTTGAQCDVAGAPLDVDLGDIDGDLDLDLLHGSRLTVPRMFQNRLEENGGALLGFRDVTGAAGAGTFPTGYATGADNYEEELADMDGDGDLDLYGINWPGFTDVVMNNTGNGTFDGMQLLPSSVNDDIEGDVIDYDNDGDLDLIVAAFVGTNRLYRNDYAGGGPGTFSFSFVPTAASGLTLSNSLDGDVADTDGDGDYDWMTAEDDNKDEQFYRNESVANDVFAPKISHVEVIPDRAAGPAVIPVRAQVYDNAPPYTTWYNRTVVQLSVNGCRIADAKTTKSLGQIFRSELPGNLVGQVSYRFRSDDEFGNAGFSATGIYTSTWSGPAYASGFGAGSAGSLGVPALAAVSVPMPGKALVFAGSGLPAGAMWWIAITNQTMPGAPLAVPGLCNINLAGTVLLQKTGLADLAGFAALLVPIPPSIPPGAGAHAQLLALDGTGGNLLSSSAGLSFTVQ